MKILTATALCMASLVLTACPRPTPPVEPKVVKLPLQSKTECELVYRAGKAKVVENFCNTQWRPVKVYIEDQKYSVDWIDERTSRRVFSKGCGPASGCYYELKLEGVTVNGRFAYATPLLRGEYTFEIDANENSRLLEEEIHTVPVEDITPIASAQTRTPAL